MRKNIEKLINSGITAHTVAVDTGIPRNTAYRIFSGEAKIDNITLKNAEILNDYFLKKEGFIKNIIEKFERGKVELENDDPAFHEFEYKNGPTNEWIVHSVKGYKELEFFFAEHDFVKDFRQKIFDGDTDALNVEEMELEEYADRFNYDEVVAYRVDGGNIEWI